MRGPALLFMGRRREQVYSGRTSRKRPDGEHASWQYRTEDYYKLLGVERAAKAEDISKAYKKLARKYHRPQPRRQAGRGEV